METMMHGGKAVRVVSRFFNGAGEAKARIKELTSGKQWEVFASSLYEPSEPPAVPVRVTHTVDGWGPLKKLIAEAMRKL